MRLTEIIINGVKYSDIIVHRANREETLYWVQYQDKQKHNIKFVLVDKNKKVLSKSYYDCFGFIDGAKNAIVELKYNETILIDKYGKEQIYFGDAVVYAVKLDGHILYNIRKNDYYLIMTDDYKFYLNTRRQEINTWDSFDRVKILLTKQINPANYRIKSMLLDDKINKILIL